MNPLIPESYRGDVAEALKAAGLDGEPRLSPLAGGASGALVFALEARGRPYVLRIDTQRDALRDPRRQYACMALVSEAGLSPRLHYADADRAVAITDRIAARPLQEHPGGGAGLMAEVGGLIRRLQGLPAFPPLMPYMDAMAAVIAGFRTTGLLEGQVFEPCLQRFVEVQAAWPRDAAVPGHNDLNPGNLLYDGERLWLIDWESAFQTDPWVDVAATANFFDAGPEAEAGLLRAAFGRAGEEERARLVLARQINRIFYAMIMLSTAAAGRPPGAAPEPALDAWPMPAVRVAIADGRLQIGMPAGMRIFGAAFLAAAEEAGRSVEMAAALKRVGDRA